MPKIITENDIEQGIIRLLTEPEMGYSHVNCMTVEPETLPDGSGRSSKKQVVLPEVLRNALGRLNPEIPAPVLDRVAADLSAGKGTFDMIPVNYECYMAVLNGIEVEFSRNGRQTRDKVRLVDFSPGHCDQNDFTVVSQLWIQGQYGFRRPDLILYVNGLPLVFIELKNSDIKLKSAYDKNLTSYRQDIPNLFAFNQFCVLSNAVETRLGAFSADYNYFFEWLRNSETEKPDRQTIRQTGTSIEYLIHGLFRKEQLLDYIENFILFSRNKGAITKIIAQNHQYLGVNNAIDSFLHKEEKAGKLGVFWHTQGSGKSFSMVMFARKINRKFPGNHTFLIVTDRDDLDGQIVKNFTRCGVIGTEEECRPKNSAQLREYLQSNRGFIFTLIQKFRYDKGRSYPVLSTRDDIIVMVDEAHRTQYKDLADNMRTGLPNANFIAFTGTPLLGSKKLTNQWFGDYVSEYNFAQSIEDGATVPLFYSNRTPKVGLTNDFLDSDFAEIVENENLNDDEIKHLETLYAKELEVLKRDDRLDKIARHIVHHFPRRGYLGKGMVVSVDKYTTVKLYGKVRHYWNEEIKSLNQQITRETDPLKRVELKKIVDYMRHIEMAVVISEDAEEERKFQEKGIDIRPIRDRINRVDDNGADIEDNFKDPDNPLSLVFVCSMWLTGFDVPCLSTLYLDKPMKGHTLMQAIARANRVFPGKSSGIIVDYVNIFRYMKKALGQYATSGSSEMPVKEIDKLVQTLDNTIAETDCFCRNIGVDFRRVLNTGTVFRKLDAFAEFQDLILANDDHKERFFLLTSLMENLHDAAKPDIFQMAWSNELFSPILYLRDLMRGTVRDDRIEKAKSRINDLLDQSIEASAQRNGKDFVISEGKVIDLSKLDVEQLRKDLKETPYKNIAIADLRTFIEEKLHALLEKNVTRLKFSEHYKAIIDNYNAGSLSTEATYEALVKFIEQMSEEEQRGHREGLSEAELELFDLLCEGKQLTLAEEKKVKLAAEELYQALLLQKNNLMVVEWYKDPQPKSRVYDLISSELNRTLPPCYGRELFNAKVNQVFNHILDQARTGIAWGA